MKIGWIRDQLFLVLYGEETVSLEEAAVVMYLAGPTKPLLLHI